MYHVVAWSFFALCETADKCVTTLGVQHSFLSSSSFRSIVALLTLVPPLTLDAVRFAHRLVGPIYRFRKTVQAIATGEPVSLVQLRRGDFLTDFRDDFNAMLRRLEQNGFVLLKAPENSQAIETIPPVNSMAPTAVGSDS
jgi:nitrogen fixation/metabolism regulation signal transduction histidine kinase